MLFVIRGAEHPSPDLPLLPAEQQLRQQTDSTALRGSARAIITSAHVIRASRELVRLSVSYLFYASAMMRVENITYACVCITHTIDTRRERGGLRFDRFDFRMVWYGGFDVASIFPQGGPSMLLQVKVRRFGFGRIDVVSVSMCFLPFGD